MPPACTSATSLPAGVDVVAVPVATGPTLLGEGHGLDLDHLDGDRWRRDGGAPAGA